MIHQLANSTKFRSMSGLERYYLELLHEKGINRSTERAYLAEIARIKKSIDLCKLKSENQVLVHSLLNSQKELFEAKIRQLQTQIDIERSANRNRPMQYEKVDDATLDQRQKKFEQLLEKNLEKINKTKTFDHADWFISECRKEFNANLGRLIELNENNMDVRPILLKLQQFDVSFLLLTFSVENLVNLIVRHNFG